MNGILRYRKQQRADLRPQTGLAVHDAQTTQNPRWLFVVFVWLRPCSVPAVDANHRGAIGRIMRRQAAEWEGAINWRLRRQVLLACGVKPGDAGSGLAGMKSVERMHGRRSYDVTR